MKIKNPVSTANKKMNDTQNFFHQFLKRYKIFIYIIAMHLLNGNEYDINVYTVSN